jgi:hypothetical protein
MYSISGQLQYIMALRDIAKLYNVQWKRALVPSGCHRDDILKYHYLTLISSQTILCYILWEGHIYVKCIECNHMKNRLAHIKPTGVICLGYFITYAWTPWSSKNLALLHTDTFPSRLFVFCLHLSTFGLSAPENHHLSSSHLNQGLSASILPSALLSTISVAILVS